MSETEAFVAKVAAVDLIIKNSDPWPLIDKLNSLVDEAKALSQGWRPFTVIAIYADDDTRYAECVMAADPEAAEAAVREAAPAEIIIAGVIAGHVVLVG